VTPALCRGAEARWLRGTAFGPALGGSGRRAGGPAAPRRGTRPLAEPAGRGEVGLEAGGGAVSHGRRAGGRRPHCVIPREWSRGAGLMRSLLAGPGNHSLTADGSRLGPPILQDTSRPSASALVRDRRRLPPHVCRLCQRPAPAASFRPRQPSSSCPRRPAELCRRCQPEPEQ